MSFTRVALIASYAPSIVSFRGALVGAMREAGHEVLCAAPDFDAGTRGAVEALGAETAQYPLGRTGLNPFADLASQSALTALFRRWRPDIVMGYTPKPAIYGSLAAARAGVSRIVPMITGLGYAFLEGGGTKQALLRRVSTRLYAAALRKADGVIFHNIDDAQVLIDLGCVPAELPVHIVSGSGVDIDHFAQQTLPPMTRGLTFLMIARLVGYKGVREYCAAARSLKALWPESEWLLVGPDESGPAGFPVHELAEFADAVTWVGPADDVRGHLARCHVYVLPSYGEGMPRTVLEALATGRPIITTDTRGCRETVRDDRNGILVPIRDADALARAMATLLDEPQRLADMGAASRRLAEERFDVRRVNAEMLTALGISP